MAVAPPSTVHGGQYDAKYVAFKFALQAARVAEKILGGRPEPVRKLLSPCAEH